MRGGVGEGEGVMHSVRDPSIVVLSVKSMRVAMVICGLFSSVVLKVGIGMFVMPSRLEGAAPLAAVCSALQRSL